MTADYHKLKVGLEIHQQLDTAHKLFCKCPTKLSTKSPEIIFMRKLRPTQSELGEIDPAALFEFKKGKTIVYEADCETSCLVEADEEPPHELNREAIDVCLTVALMMKAKPVDEIHTMRKIVIDGSNTTGFQRTAVIALGGEIEVDGKTIPIQTICLEEDAARKTREEGMIVHYRIDRLGIPLIEIATAPVICSPEEAGKVALAIGKILRATGKVRRGLGTIRQDINISIPEGNLIEIKGVQELDLLPKVIEYEVQRQLNLLKIRDELKRRGAKKEDLKEDFIDVTSIFKETKCQVIKNALDRKGKALAVKLTKFSGLLGKELVPNLRFGSEMADRAVFWGRVGGIFHTDELPGYGISLEEANSLRDKLGGSVQDAIVLAVGEPENVIDALSAVVERAKEAIEGVPTETRSPKPDGTTRYERPRPGAARMYPETDVFPVPITENKIRSIKLPELTSKKFSRLIKEYGLHQKLINQLLDAGYDILFEEIAKSTKVPASVIATVLTEVIKSLKRGGVNVDLLSDDQIIDTFKLVDSGAVTKEAIPDILTWLSSHEAAKPVEALEPLGLKRLSLEELKTTIDEMIEKNKDLIRERGGDAKERLIGIVMSKVRGKADAKLVTKLVEEKLGSILKKL